MVQVKSTLWPCSLIATLQDSLSFLLEVSLWDVAASAGADAARTRAARQQLLQ